MMRVSANSALGQYMRRVDPFPVQIDSVIWAIGYQDNSDWVAVPEVKDKAGNFIHEAGISPIKNLYFIGRSWQRTHGSALIVGVGDDALYLTKHITQEIRDSTKKG